MEKLKKSEIVSLHNGLMAVLKLTGVVFGFAVNKNLAIIKSEIESLQKALTPSDKFMEYDNKRVEIVKKYAKKDEKGQPVLETDAKTQKQNFIIDDLKGLEEEVKPLKEEYKETISEYENQIKDYNDLLETTSDIELYKVKLGDLPKDITVEQQGAIFKIIEE